MFKQKRFALSSVSFARPNIYYFQTRTRYQYYPKDYKNRDSEGDIDLLDMTQRKLTGSLEDALKGLEKIHNIVNLVNP